MQKHALLGFCTVAEQNSSLLSVQLVASIPECEIECIIFLCKTGV
jgi:hypothetical protein